MDLNLTEAKLQIADDRPAPANYLTVAMELFAGGSWLGACRAWMQSNLPRGDQITWGDDKPMLELTPKQLESLSYRVAVAAVNADRAALVQNAYEDNPVIHFVLSCMSANVDRPGARRRLYQVDVYAQSLAKAREAYYAQTVMYEVEIKEVLDAKMCAPAELRGKPEILFGLSQYKGAFLVESLQNW